MFIYATQEHLHGIELAQFLSMRLRSGERAGQTATDACRRRHVIFICGVQCMGPTCMNALVSVVRGRPKILPVQTVEPEMSTRRPTVIVRVEVSSPGSLVGAGFSLGGVAVGRSSWTALHGLWREGAGHAGGRTTGDPHPGNRVRRIGHGVGAELVVRTTQLAEGLIGWVVGCRRRPTHLVA